MSLAPSIFVTSPPLFVTAQDEARLRTLIERYVDGQLAAQAEQLEWELERATVVPRKEIPSDVVTMNARLVVEDVVAGRQREIVLVYPETANPSEGRISVLAPVGTAILGLRAGDSVDWPLPNGRSTTLRIIEVVYQPEAAGDWAL